MIDKLKEIKKLELQDGVFSVYDMDGKTTQEILNQFFYKINNVIDATNASITLMEYLLNEGLEEETAKILVEWLENGKLKEIIDEQVLNEIIEKVNNAVNTVEETKEEINKITVELEDNFDFLKDATSNNIKFYGAKGDGETDDTEAFKKALFGLQYTNSNIITIPGGTYLISESLEIPKDVTLLGQEDTIIKFTSNHISLILKGKDITIKDVIFDGNADNGIVTTDIIKDIDGVTINNINIENVIFNNFAGTELNAINLKHSKNVYIQNCLFDNLKGKQAKCINIQGYSQELYIKNNMFKNIKHFSSFSDKTYCIYIDTMSTNIFNKANAEIKDNYFKSDVYANIYITTKNVVINNNTFTTNNSNAMYNHAVLINEGEHIKIKNNHYDLANDVMIFYPVIKVLKGNKIFILNENIILDGQKITELNTDKQLYDLKNCDVTIDNINVTGKHTSDSLIVGENIKALTIKKCNIDLNGNIQTFLNISGSNTMTIKLNDNNIYMFKSSRFINANNFANIEVINNVFSYTSKYDTSIYDCILLRDFKNAIIESNKLKDEISLHNFEILTLQNNTFASLYILSDKYDVISQNNIFNGNKEYCYTLSCHSNEECNFVSKNNYNKNNRRLIRFYSTKGNFLNAYKMNIQTVDDIHSEEVQKQNELCITRDDNVTVDIYQQCFVKSSQSLRRFTYYSNDKPLIDYKKPHGTIIYNASTGKSTLYANYKGFSRLTNL